MVAQQLRRFEQACESVGRDPADCGKLVLTGLRLDDGLRTVEEFRSTVAAYEAIGMTDLVIHWPRPHAPYEGSDSILDDLSPTDWA